MFINIVEEKQRFDWVPKDEDGKPTETKMTLRVLSDDERTALRQRHNHILFKNGQRVDEFDNFGFTDDAVDLALVGWVGVRAAGTENDLPCTRDWKLRLPDRVKLEIVRLCAAREAGKLFDAVAEKKS